LPILAIFTTHRMGAVEIMTDTAKKRVEQAQLQVRMPL